MELVFAVETVTARFVDPDGWEALRKIEIRTNPITSRSSRITLSRSGEQERGMEAGLPAPPPDAKRRDACPFCRPQLLTRTPRCVADLAPAGRLVSGTSVLFPNLFPYGRYSAVSLFDDRHFVEIGTASVASYRDSLLNCAEYLRRIRASDSQAVFMAITQNHLPSAGGSLVHPHLQVHADRIASNHHRFLRRRAEEHRRETGERLFAAYLRHERQDGNRYIGATGPWEWMAAFAPEGFYEIWGILPDCTSFRQLQETEWEHLALGMIRTQQFYRSLCRNGYNFGLLLIEDGNDFLEMRAVILARSNFAPWVRSDHTGYELMLGDMATFTPPEETARLARNFWK